MKILKTTFIILLAISMLFTVSCSKPSETNNKGEQCVAYPAMIASYEDSLTVGGFEVTINSINLSFNSAKIVITATNSTGKIGSFDNEFDIEKSHDDHWESCKTEVHSHNTNQVGIPETGTVEATYDLSHDFDITETGKYRFKTNLYEDVLGSNTKHPLVVEFEVSYDNIIPTVHTYEIAPEKVTIDIHWENNTDQTIYLTDNVYVEALVSGSWVECDKTDVEKNFLLSAVAHGESAEKTYVLDEIYDLSYYGHYRVYLDYIIKGEEHDITNCALVEFFIPFDMSEFEIIH